MTKTQRNVRRKLDTLERAVVVLKIRYEDWRQLHEANTFERVAQAAWGNKDAQREARQLERAERRLRAQHERVRRLIGQTEAAIGQASRQPQVSK